MNENRTKANVQLLGGGSLNYLSDDETAELSAFVSNFLSKTGSRGLVVSLDESQAADYESIKEIFVDQVLQP